MLGRRARGSSRTTPVELVLTSPPYPSTYDYLPMQHLRHVWLGERPDASARDRRAPAVARRARGARARSGAATPICGRANAARALAAGRPPRGRDRRRTRCRAASSTRRSRRSTRATRGARAARGASVERPEHAGARTGASTRSRSQALAGHARARCTSRRPLAFATGYFAAFASSFARTRRTDRARPRPTSRAAGSARRRSRPRSGCAQAPRAARPRAGGSFHSTSSHSSPASAASASTRSFGL